MVSRINFVSPISLSKTKGITKGRLIRDRGKIIGPLEIRHIEGGDVEVENPIGVSLIRPYSCNTRILPYPAVSCRILSYPAVSCRILPYPAVSCGILPYPAVSCRICRIVPYPAFPAVSCLMPVTETLNLTLTLTLTVILTWSFSYW